ncbi:MAG TPA: RNA polymerase sigma-70 factor [Pedobacter sp.]|nr:RNA polymerase sigma-70 factor [Pedobacter sp.]
MSTYGSFTDQELIALLKGSDMRAFDEIYLRYADSLFKFAYSVLRAEDECRDVVQDIFVWFWQNRESLQVTSLKSYLFASVKFNLVKFVKTSKRRSEILEFVPKQQEIFEDHAMELKELTQLIREFVGELPVRAREIFELSRDQHLSNKEIALKLGISEKTVENQMTIVLKKLKVNLGRHSFLLFFV